MYKTHVYNYIWWLQVVGSIKLYVSFAKETYKRDDILQKRLIIVMSTIIILCKAQLEEDTYIYIYLCTCTHI